jgi:dynein heavy chain
VFSDWLNVINEKLNDDNESKKDGPDDGPKKELEYWRSRMQKITSWCE